MHAARVAHVLGKQAAFGYDVTTFKNVGLNFSMVYEALALVDMVDVPATCEDIYGLTFTDISNDHLMVPQSADTIAAGGAATVEGHYLDTEWELYIKNIRNGRLDGDAKEKSTWPLEDFTVDCPGEVQTLGTAYVPGTAPGVTGDAEGTALTDDQKKYMYAHCLAQFQFASVGTQAWEGTYGIPLPGIEPGPFFYPYPQADGFNGTSSYNMRARMYLGQRFGLSVWAYVPMFLATCFLLGDCIVFFFEALTPITLGGHYAFASNTLNNVRDSLVIMATTRASRRKRLAIGFGGLRPSSSTPSSSPPVRLLYTSLPHPTGNGDMLGDPTACRRSSKAGRWRADWTPVVRPRRAVHAAPGARHAAAHTTEMCRSLNKSLNDADNGRTTVSGIQRAAQCGTTTRRTASCRVRCCPGHRHPHRHRGPEHQRSSFRDGVGRGRRGARSRRAGRAHL